MTTITGETKDDARQWQTLKTVVFVGGLAVAIYGAGWAAGRDSSSIQAVTVGERLSAHEQRSEVIYVRKDGSELASLRERVESLSSQVQKANDKLDYLIRNRP